MNLKQMEAFVQVADSGSFSKAAKELFLTQPTISAHIATLEKELSVRLFVRNTKEVSLSEDGRMLYKYARQMVDLEKTIWDTFAADAARQSQCIKIAASTVPSQYLLPELLASFNQKYPNEQFKVMETDSAKVVEQIVSHAVDVGFTGTILEKKHCKYIPFYKDELVIIMPNQPEYQERLTHPEDIRWLAEERLILREEGSGTRKEAEKYMKQLGIAPEKLNVVASIENQESIKKSVISGMGVSVISRLAAKEEVENGKLICIPIPGQDGGRDLNVVYNKNFQLSQVAERFIKTVLSVHGIKRK